MPSGPLDSALEHAARRQEFCERIKQVIVHRLELPIPPSWITDDQPLFGRGLELDSLDALELSMGIDSEFGVAIYEDNVALFGSVSSFVDYMIANQPDVVAAVNAYPGLGGATPSAVSQSGGEAS